MNCYFTGLQVSTNQQTPCESAHEITLSLSQPIKPLTLSFPHPFLVDNVNTTLRRKGRCINLILTKAVKEPWPIEFQAKENSKLEAERLKPWKGRKTFDSLTNFLGTKFNVLREIIPLKPSPLDGVIETIRKIFTVAFLQDQQNFAIKRREPSEKPDWYLRVHLPILTSTTGNLVLMLTAFDNILSEKLTAAGKQIQQNVLADFHRVFNQAPKEHLKIFLESEEEAQLWRYVLRLNSTKMVPSAWQKKHIPLGEESPWLATFISPLYLDCPYDSFASFNSDRSSTGPVAFGEKSSCASCEISSPNLKRCSRCQSVVYCGPECQRSHWSKHKIVCTKK